MTPEEAMHLVEEQWKDIAEQHLGYEIAICDTCTTEYTWGWHIIFLPTDPNLPNIAVQYAVDRLSGESVPLGTKGLQTAVEILMLWRQKLGISG